MMRLKNLALLTLLAAGTAVAAERAPSLPDAPHFGGTCLTCPQYDFGPFTPTALYQDHCSTTSTDTDCNVYAFDVTPGERYEFSTCPPAAAAFATTLRVFRADTCALIGGASRTCGNGATVTLAAPAGVTRLLVQVAGELGAAVPFGDYCLSYRTLPPCAFSCAVPRPGVYVPTTTCQAIADAIDDCSDNWYQFALTAGSTYDFATCPAMGPCVTGPLIDTIIEVYSPACMLMLSNDDSCVIMPPVTSWVTYTPTVSGIHVVRVRGGRSQVRGSVTMGYMVRGCASPVITSIAPPSGIVPPPGCSTRTETFTVTYAGVGSTTLDWRIVPPAGGSATPASGSVLSVTGSASFTSTLVRPACPGPSRFQVEVAATNVCGTDTQSIVYSLSETTPPRLSGCPASRLLDCTALVPPAPTLTATDNCDPSPPVVFTETLIPGSCPGNSAIVRSWVATDCSGNQRRCLQNIVRRDRTPPSLTGSDAWCLHPIDHAYYCVTTAELSPTMTDDCSPPLRMTFVSCTSSEPDSGTGPDDLPNDCIVSPDGTQACLRVERAGDLVDRTYVLGAVAVDACGNRSAPRPVAVVTVPHDDLPHPECRPSDSGYDVHF